MANEQKPNQPTTHVPMTPPLAPVTRVPPAPVTRVPISPPPGFRQDTGEGRKK